MTLTEPNLSLHGASYIELVKRNVVQKWYQKQKRPKKNPPDGEKNRLSLAREGNAEFLSLFCTPKRVRISEVSCIINLAPLYACRLAPIVLFGVEGHESYSQRGHAVRVG